MASSLRMDKCVYIFCKSDNDSWNKNLDMNSINRLLKIASNDDLLKILLTAIIRGSRIAKNSTIRIKQSPICFPFAMAVLPCISFPTSPIVLDAVVYLLEVSKLIFIQPS